MEWIAEMSSPVVERSLSSSPCLYGEAKESKHSQTGVLDLSQLKNLLLLRISCEAKWVEEFASGVKSVFRVKLGIPLELDISDDQYLDPD